MRVVAALLFSLVVVFGSPRSGLCPFAGEQLVGLSALQSLGAAPLCNVSLLGSRLCACFNDQCSSHCGCLVPAGTCTKNSCGLPRICFCDQIDANPAHGASCSPVNGGPCAICNHTSASDANTAPHKRVVTPAVVLHSEYSRLTDARLESLLKSVHAPVPVTREQKISLLIKLVHKKELEA